MQNVLNSTLQQTSTNAHQALQGDVALGADFKQKYGGFTGRIPVLSKLWGAVGQLGTGSHRSLQILKQLKASKFKHIKSLTIKLNRTSTDDLASKKKKKKRDFGG